MIHYAMGLLYSCIGIMCQSSQQHSAIFYLITQLSEDAFGKVFKGIDKKDKSKVYAIKKIVDRSRMLWHGRDALIHEITCLIVLREEPSIVRIHDYFLEPDQCYLVLELLPGKNLLDRIKQKGTFTEVEARDACRSILEGLKYMHQKRIVHRNLKPESLLVVVSEDHHRTCGLHRI